MYRQRGLGHSTVKFFFDENFKMSGCYFLPHILTVTTRYNMWVLACKSVGKNRFLGFFKKNRVFIRIHPI